jgi:hypothetical protein
VLPQATCAFTHLGAIRLTVCCHRRAHNSLRAHRCQPGVCHRAAQRESLATLPAL